MNEKMPVDITFVLYLIYKLNVSRHSIRKLNTYKWYKRLLWKEKRHHPFSKDNMGTKKRKIKVFSPFCEWEKKGSFSTQKRLDGKRTQCLSWWRLHLRIHLETDKMVYSWGKCMLRYIYS